VLNYLCSGRTGEEDEEEKPPERHLGFELPAESGGFGNVEIGKDGFKAGILRRFIVNLRRFYVLDPRSPRHLLQNLPGPLLGVAKPLAGGRTSSLGSE
jgi:hypothetical protein